MLVNGRQVASRTSTTFQEQTRAGSAEYRVQSVAATGALSPLSTAIVLVDGVAVSTTTAPATTTAGSAGPAPTTTVAVANPAAAVEPVGQPGTRGCP